MKVVIISNYFNHHQKPICDSLNRLTYGGLTFVATERVSESRKRLGYQDMTESYVIDCSEGKNRQKAISIINGADVVITDAEDLSLTQQRYRERKLTFRSCERLFKTRSRYLKVPVHIHKAIHTRKMYLLCNSAFTAADFRSIGFFRHRAYKWGYFPEDKEYKNLDCLMGNQPILSFLWAGRLIKYKHPEYAIFAAKLLRSLSIPFSMDIIGDGEMMGVIKDMISDSGLESTVILRGPMSPDLVRTYMEQSDIFLFTSDRHEGWGAVLNEAMNSACAVVANREIGSVPYLINDGFNGLYYSNKREFLRKVEILAMNESYRHTIAKAAYNTINTIWNADNAANNLLTLVECLHIGKDNPIVEGPCSSAE